MPELGKISRFEIAKFVHGQELAFRIRNRRNKLLALWAASEMGLNAASAEAYGRSIVAAGVGDREDHGIVRLIAHDVAASGVGFTEQAVRAEAERLHRRAAEEIVAADGRRDRAA
jgi:hypothetical protein